ncbi:RsiV family protein, partial [Brucella sp. 21LCYQ03]|nr:RsiV family protein [Brucella sp. 21LCYQ03]
AERQQELINLGESHFRTTEGLAPNDPLSGRYFFDEGIFTLADNFAFSKTGLVFQYNPYEIKAWSEGVTRIEIPYKELKDLLTDQGRKIVAEIENTYR